jgi:ABC-type transport system substrate-binding protein
VSEEVAIKKARKGGEMHRRGQIIWRDDDSGADAILVIGSGYGPHRKDRFHNDPELFALVDETVQVFDPQEREKVLNNLYRRLRDEHYQFGIGYYNILWATGPRVLTWQPNPIALYPSALYTLTLN